MKLIELHMAKTPTYEYQSTEFSEISNENKIVINAEYIQGVCRWEEDRDLPSARTYIRFSNGDVIFVMENYEYVASLLIRCIKISI